MNERTSERVGEWTRGLAEVSGVAEAAGEGNSNVGTRSIVHDSSTTDH